MKKFALAVLLAGFCGAAAQAQTTTTTTTTTFEPAWRPQIKEYVLKEHRATVAPPPGFTVSVGAPLPAPVELYSFPSSVPYARYRYAQLGDETVVVDPGDRKIVDVIR